MTTPRKKRKALEASAAAAPSASNEPVAEALSVTINRAVELTGVPRSGLYEQIAAGRLEVARVGRRSLITMQSLRRLIAEGVRQREAEVNERVEDYKRRVAKRRQAQRGQAA